MKQNRRGIWYILPSLLGMCVFFLIPFAISFRYMLTKGATKLRFVGLENFRELMKNPAFLLAIKNTAIFMVVAIPLVTMGALLLAILLQDSKNGFVRWALLTPMIIPVASALLGWSAVFGTNGIIGYAVQAFGGAAKDYFQDPYARWVMIFIFVVKNLGYMTIILGGAVAGLPKEYREVFSLDSTSTLKYTFKVVVPNILPVIFFVVILSVVNGFQIFREIYALYGNYPPQSLYMLQNFMNNNFANLNYNRLCTASFVVSMAIAVLISIYIYLQSRAERREGKR